MRTRKRWEVSTRKGNTLSMDVSQNPPPGGGASLAVSLAPNLKLGGERGDRRTAKLQRAGTPGHPREGGDPARKRDRGKEAEARQRSSRVFVVVRRSDGRVRLQFGQRAYDIGLRQPLPRHRPTPGRRNRALLLPCKILPCPVGKAPQSGRFLSREGSSVGIPLPMRWGIRCCTRTRQGIR